MLPGFNRSGNPARSLSAGVRLRRTAAVILAGAVGLTALIGLPAATLAAGSLTMTGFSPASGPVGTVVTITGSGFVSGDIVAFNGTGTNASTASKTGVKLKASVPAFATSGPITVTDPKTQQTVGLPKGEFTVKTGLFATPNHVWAGGSLTLEGSALTPDRAESIDLGKVNVGKAETDAFGDFSVSISIPWGTSSGRTTMSVVDPLGRSLVPIYVVGDWPQFRYEPDHSGVQPYEPTLSGSTVRGLSVQWTYNTGEQDIDWLDPTVADGEVFVGTNYGSLYALSASTGTLLWNLSTSTSFSSPAVANGVAYTFVGDGSVRALDASTGVPEWMAETSPGFVTSPAVAGGVVYVVGYKAYALNASTGALEWRTGTSPDSASSPAVANGMVYFGADNGDVYALNAATGALDWTYTTGAAISSSPAVANGMVFIGSNDDKVYALDASSGARIWSYSTGAFVQSSPAVANGIVYVGSDNGKVYALRAATGALDWVRPTGTGYAVTSSPAVANGVVYVGSDNSHLYALNASTGVVEWNSMTNGLVDHSPAVANGLVYVGATDEATSASLYAFGL